MRQLTVFGARGRSAVQSPVGCSQTRFQRNEVTVTARQADLFRAFQEPFRNLFWCFCRGSICRGSCIKALLLTTRGGSIRTDPGSSESRRASTAATGIIGDSVLVGLVDTTQDARITGLWSAVRGGHATILRGTLAGTQVALKLPDLRSHVDRELLRREVKVWRTVRHRHVLPLRGIYDDGLQVGLMTMWLRNGHLLRYIRENDGADVNQLIREVAEGLKYLHVEARIVHGDLKCENVLISDSGHALLADCGLSTFIDKEPDDRTSITQIRGQYTLAFSAPELLVDAVHDIPTGTADGGSTTFSARRKRSKTVETDVYAYGMLVYQAFTGQPPWHSAQNAMQLHALVQAGARPPHPGPAAQERGLDAVVWTICNLCWEPEPRLRPKVPDIIRLFTTLKP